VQVQILFNDALNPDEQIKLLMGQKVGPGVPGVLGIGRRYFKGRDIQTAANILKIARRCW
jgi:hypothetical protein